MKKVIIILLFIFSIIIPFRTDFFAVKIYASENENIDYSFKNLAVPDLEGKEYLYNGVYRLSDINGVAIDYNVYSGIISINGAKTSNFTYLFTDYIPIGEYTLSYHYVDGSMVATSFYIGNSGAWNIDVINGTNNYTVYKTRTNTQSVQTRLYFAFGDTTSFDNYQFKLQLEKGDTATPYTAPLESYLWHERQLSFEEGYDVGYNDGFCDGSSAGYYGGYDDGYGDGYYDGQSDGTVVGTYKVDTWENETSVNNTFLRFYDVEPSIDGNLSLSLLENKNTLVDNKDLYFNFDYGDFYITPFENYADYLNSGYQYAPYQTLGAGNMLKIENSSIDIIDKGNLIATHTLTELENNFFGFNCLYIIQLVREVDYYMAFNAGRAAGYDVGSIDGYNDGYNDGRAAGYSAGYDVGSIDGYNDGESFGYEAGSIDGYYSGYDVGSIDGYNLGYNLGFDDGQDVGFNDGYQKAINDGSTEFGLTTLLSSLFVGLGSLLSIQLLPNISIGMIIAVPIVFGIIAFILGKRGGGD